MKTNDSNSQLEALEEKLKTSEERLAEAELRMRQLEGQYLALFHHLAEEVHLWKLIREQDGRIKTWELADANPAALRTWGKKKEEVIGKTTDEIFGKGTTEQFLPIVKGIVETGEPHKWVEYFKATNQYLSMSSIPVGEYFVSTGKDITEEKLAAKALEESEDFLKRTGEIAKVGGWQLTGDFDRPFYTKGAYDILELPYDSNPSVEEAINFYHTDDRKKVAQYLSEAIEKGSPFNFEARLLTAQDNLKWVLVMGEPEMLNGKCVKLTGVFQDITNRKKTDSRVNMLTKAIDHSLNGFDVVDHEGKFIYVNKAHSRMFGFSDPVEIIGTSPEKLCADPAFPERLVKNLKEKGEYVCELKAKRKDGSEFDLLMYSRLDYDENGKEIYPTSSIDITERRKTEEEKRKVQNQLLQITNSIPGVIYQFVFHKDGSFSMPFINDKANEILGFSSEQMKDPAFLFSRIHPEDFESTMHSILEANHDQAKWTKTFRAYNKDEKVVWIAGHALGSADEEGNIVHNGVLFDISEQKEAGIALKASQQQYQNVANNLPGIVLRYQHNTDGRNQLLFISTGVETLFEVDAQEAINNNQLLWDRVHKEDLAAYYASVNEASLKLSPWKFEHRLQFPDGRVKWVDMRGVPSKKTDGSIIWDSIGLDITKRKEAERELERINKNLEELVEERAQKAIKLSRELELYWLAAEHAKSGVWYYNVRTNALEWDNTMYELFGIDKDEFSGAYEAWENSLHPDDIEENVSALQETITEQKDLDILFRINHRKSGEIRHIRGKGKAETDDKGNTVAVFGTNWDVTREMKLAVERERAIDQLKAAQAQLIQSEKMASLGILTAGVAHELNNPLNYIVGGYTAIHNHLNEDEVLDKAEIEEYLDWIKTGADRATKIVKSLNLFSRSNEDNTEVCDIHQIIDDCLLMLQNKFKDRITITKEYTGTPAEVPGNNGKLHQALLNLLANAMDAISEKGEITIETSSQKDRLNIIISDNGCGIPEGNLKKVMDPFFTTKPPGVGTGLGLSITHSIIQEHQGSLTMQSTPDAGTQVKISLPKERKHAK
ncbi:MAG: PAS domain-containing protein [Phaeodactylibacter sp.]|uniref:PAS domain-containing sensor histidine kinase n=1 Tax=Phaeodactylibacter sp. TaxID=1940289 RepID=UPI0032ECB7FF